MRARENLGRENVVFWRTIEKKLIAAPIETVSVEEPEHCLGRCLQNVRCKSFSVHQDEKICHLFAEDRCSWDVRWEDKEHTAYFDLIATDQCPASKCNFEIFFFLVKIVKYLLAGCKI